MARRLTWLGQAGFRADLDGLTVVIDPWLSPHADRLTPAPPVELAADGVDVLLVTHEHLDHLDVPFLPVFLERSPDALVVMPAPVGALVDIPESRLRLVAPGDALEVRGLEVRVTPAVHGVGPEDAYGDGSAIDGRPRFVGYALRQEPDRRGIFHAGDTLVTPELTATLEAIRPDVMLLPINGRDPEREARGIVGNMDASEAVELALGVGADLLVPYHWDGFRGNTVPPGSAVDAAAGRLHVLLPARDRPFELEAA